MRGGRSTGVRRARSPRRRATCGRNGARLQGASGYRVALLKLHRAFDLAAGQRVLADDVAEFLRQHPEFGPYRADVERLFASSRQAFFANDVENARSAMPLPALTRAQRSARRGRAEGGMNLALDIPMVLVLLPLALLPLIFAVQKAQGYPSLVAVAPDPLSRAIDIGLHVLGALAIAALIAGIGGLHLKGQSVERVGEGAHMSCC